MKNVIRKAVAIFGTSLLIVSFNANASDECVKAIQELEATIASVPVKAVTKTDEGFIGRNGQMDKDGLLTKAKAARMKLDAWKVDDAVDKLLAVRDKADDLANTPNPSKQKLTNTKSYPYADWINDDAVAALSCIDEM